MRPFRGIVLGCALAALAAGGGPARAAWNNVFQVCCHNCRSSASYASPITAYAAPAAGPCCPQSCPQQTCTTRYVQRCYYQPVTTYQQQTYYEPVTTYRTSYYYEPVTSYRYSCYYDPCTCRYQQVACPTTCYRLRSQCCPVTSYLQRCCLKPVTTYQQVNYYEPVTTCCTTTVGPPVLGQAPVTGQAPVNPQPPPGVQDSGSSQPPAVPPGNPPPGVRDSQYPNTSNSIRRYGNGQWNPPAGRMPPASDGGFRQPQLRAPQPLVPVPAAPGGYRTAPQVRLDRIAALPGHNMEGRVLSAARVPQPGARVLFVSLDRKGKRQTATTDGDGQFRVTLAAGRWFVYVHDAAGRPVLSQKVDVSARELRTVTLTSR